MTNPIRIKSEWQGGLNHFPATVILTIHENEGWGWTAELFWEAQYAIDHKFFTGRLWWFEPEESYDTETEAYRAAERFLLAQGFLFVKDIQ